MSDNGNLIDEYSVLREIVLHTGKAFGFLILAVLIDFISINYLFLIAVVASLLLNILPAQNNGHNQKI
jgi:hypothetical protein